MARKYLNEIGLPDEAIEGLSETDPRQCLWELPELRRDGNLGAYIDFKTGKITVKQFRKILGLD